MYAQTASALELERHFPKKRESPRRERDREQCIMMINMIVGTEEDSSMY